MIKMGIGFKEKIYQGIEGERIKITLLRTGDLTVLGAGIATLKIAGTTRKKGYTGGKGEFDELSYPITFEAGKAETTILIKPKLDGIEEGVEQYSMRVDCAKVQPTDYEIKAAYRKSMAALIVANADAAPEVLITLPAPPPSGKIVDASPEVVAAVVAVTPPAVLPTPPAAVTPPAVTPTPADEPGYVLARHEELAAIHYGQPAPENHDDGTVPATELTTPADEHQQQAAANYGQVADENHDDGTVPATAPIADNSVAPGQEVSPAVVIPFRPESIAPTQPVPTPNESVGGIPAVGSSAGGVPVADASNATPATPATTPTNVSAPAVAAAPVTPAWVPPVGYAPCYIVTSDLFGPDEVMIQIEKSNYRTAEGLIRQPIELDDASSATRLAFAGGANQFLTVMFRKPLTINEMVVAGNVSKNRGRMSTLLNVGYQTMQARVHQWIKYQTGSHFIMSDFADLPRPIDKVQWISNPSGDNALVLGGILPINECRIVRAAWRDESYSKFYTLTGAAIQMPRTCVVTAEIPYPIIHDYKTEALTDTLGPYLKITKSGKNRWHRDRD